MNTDKVLEQIKELYPQYLWTIFARFDCDEWTIKAFRARNVWLSRNVTGLEVYGATKPELLFLAKAEQIVERFHQDRVRPHRTRRNTRAAITYQPTPGVDPMGTAVSDYQQHIAQDISDAIYRESPFVTRQRERGAEVDEVSNVSELSRGQAPEDAATATVAFYNSEHMRSFYDINRRAFGRMTDITEF